MFHSKDDVRHLGCELIVMMYTHVGEAVREAALNLNSLKPSLLEYILKKMDHVLYKLYIYLYQNSYFFC